MQKDCWFMDLRFRSDRGGAISSLMQRIISAWGELFWFYCCFRFEEINTRLIARHLQPVMKSKAGVISLGYRLIHGSLGPLGRLVVGCEEISNISPSWRQKRNLGSNRAKKFREKLLHFEAPSDLGRKAVEKRISKALFFSHWPNARPGVERTKRRRQCWGQDRWCLCCLSFIRLKSKSLGRLESLLFLFLHNVSSPCRFFLSSCKRSPERLSDLMLNAHNCGERAQRCN